MFLVYKSREEQIGQVEENQAAGSSSRIKNNRKNLKFSIPPAPEGNLGVASDRNDINSFTTKGIRKENRLPNSSKVRIL